MFSPICTHLGCPINWQPERQHFLCPCHGGTFDPQGLVTGGPPPRGMDALEFQVRSGQLWVRWQDFKIGVAQRVREFGIRQALAEIMKDFDMCVSGSGDVQLTNQTGHPAAIVPYGFTEGEHSQPRCATIIGNLFADDKILSVAHAYQRATDWHQRHPKL